MNPLPETKIVKSKRNETYSREVPQKGLPGFYLSCKRPYSEREN